MRTKIVEATNGFNWGKFLIGAFDVEWSQPSAISTLSSQLLLAQIGHGPGEILVLDLQTSEGAIFRHGGYARADLNKHKVWVCPLFEPFLAWLYLQPDPFAISDVVHLDTPGDYAGYRREGIHADPEDECSL